MEDKKKYQTRRWKQINSPTKIQIPSLINLRTGRKFTDDEGLLRRVGIGLCKGSGKRRAVSRRGSWGRRRRGETSIESEAREVRSGGGFHDVVYRNGFFRHDWWSVDQSTVELSGVGRWKMRRRTPADWARDDPVLKFDAAVQKYALF